MRRFFFERRTSFVRRLTVHACAGALIGYFLLHPVSMYIYYREFEHPGLMSANILAQSFSRAHLPMAMFFVGLGMILGLIHGLYIHRLASLYDRVKELSVTDDLTALKNRRHFYHRFQEEIIRAQRYSKPLFLMLIDLDNFKNYNDAYGHAAGDEVLRAVAAFLNKSVRDPDLVARYGGDEFVILVPETDATRVLKMARRLCAEAVNRTLPGGRTLSDHGLSISLGIAGFPADGREIDALINKADAALYEAKRQGKNKACGSDRQTALR